MKYYVYQLIDSLTGRVFYIGKGQADRMYQHEKDARKPGNAYKLNKIRSIWRKGGKVECRKIGLFANEQQAYEWESELIRATPELTNIDRTDKAEPKDTSMGRRMYAALILKGVWPVPGEWLLLKSFKEGGTSLILRQQQAYMVKEYGI